MKPLSILAIILCILFGFQAYAQQPPASMKDYAKSWVKLDSLEGKGKTRDALALAEEIYEKARGDENEVQQVKALLYRMRLSAPLNERSDSLNLASLSAEIERTQLPIRNILYSIQGDFYYQYYQQNRWRILQRTETSVKPEDFQTWDVNTLMEAAAQSYLASVQDAGELQTRKIEDFEALLNKGKESARYRPTLYDLLVHRAIDFFSNTETGLTVPSYAFELEADAAFLPVGNFVNQTFETRDTASRNLRAIQLLQEALAFHQSRDNAYALVDLDLKRLDFSRQHAVGENKDTLYLEALEGLFDKHNSHPISSTVTHRIATQYVERASNYTPIEGDTYKWDRKKAFDLCEDAITRFPDSEGASHCRALQNQIKNKSLDLIVEEANVGDAPFRGLLKYRNLDTIYFRIIARTEALEKRIKELGYRNRKDLAYALNTQPVLKSWKELMPIDPDYNPHSVEVKIPGMPTGAFMILVSDNPAFSVDGRAIAFASTQVTNISFFSQQNGKNINVFVRDRDSGKPMKKVQVRRLSYDYRKASFKELSIPKWTNKNGEVSFGLKESNRDYILEFKKKDDFFRTDRLYDYYYRSRPGITKTVTRFFLDRTIYRPGQTVYFKGITLDHNGDEYTLKPNHSSTVTFYDVNSQEVKKIEVRSNEYGTFSGSFTAPTSGLTGRMRIVGQNGSIYFRVEEYKRPRFEVTFEPVEGSFSLGEEVKATGKAVAYAGNVIDGAEVSYRVVREARFPYWGYFYWWRPAPSSPSREIAHGVATTNEKGEFTVTFPLVPDRSLSKDSKPVFTYKVIADVTDITGETRTGETRIQAGYVALQANITVPEVVDKYQAEPFALSTQNLNGQFEAAKGTVTLYRLAAPEELLRDRRWSQPDKYLYAQNEFRNWFPNDLYVNENKIQSWDKGNPVASKDFDTGSSKEITFSELAQANPGKYLIELATSDKNGEEIQVKKYFTLTDPKEAGLPVPKVLNVRASKESAEPGETVTLMVNSFVRKLVVVYRLEKEGEIIQEERIKLSEKPYTIQIPIEEAYRGGLHYTFGCIYHNEFFSDQGSISVPWTNKQLKLSWGTFRSTLKPGAEEEWKLKISGPKGEKVAAELVAAMYDASLDAFAPSNFFGLSLYGYNSRNLRWQGSKGFGTQSSRLVTENWNPTGGGVQNHSYDRLNTFGFAMGHYYGYGYELERSGGRRSLRAGAVPQAMPSAAPMAEMAAAPPMEGEADQDGVPDAYDSALEDKVLEKKEAGGESPEGSPEEAPVSVRTNLNETAFFFPHLETNEEGETILAFTMPEALTEWKFVGLAHTKDLKIGTLTDKTVTQKELMVMPNMPRFLRQGDKIRLTAKVSNLTEAALSGTAQLILLDAFTLKPVPGKFAHDQESLAFTAEAGQSAPLAWEVSVPDDVQAVVTQVVARAGEFSDGEEHVLPILSNRMLVTESLPLPIRGNETKEFTFTKLVNSGSSSTLRHQQLALEFTSNPAWYAVQALPYLMEYPHECSEQIFSRFYANSLASHIATSTPKIQRIFEQWKRDAGSGDGGKEGLLSNLEANQDLKSVLLEETPWVLNAQDESERKRRVGLLFDLNRMADQLARAKNKLSELQNASGAYSWFPGMRDSRYITTLIATGMGHLNKLGVSVASGDPEVNAMMQKAVPYLDMQLVEDYNRLKAYAKDRMDKNHLRYHHIQHLYMRSFYPDIPVASNAQEAYDYYYGQAKTYWPEQGNYMKGMISMVLSRRGDQVIGKDVIESLRQNAINHPELGMYWKQAGGWYWYQAPIEQQSLLVEAFDEVDKDQASVEAMKVWLLKNKQTTDWKTTRATVAACNALLMTGNNLLESDQIVSVSLGGEEIDPYKREDAKVEAGSGYYKTTWSKNEIKPEMGKVKVVKNDPGVAWGALYWQYFEDLDKITYAATPLSIQKALFVEELTEAGPKLNPATTQDLNPGDKVIVRIELRVDRDMEYVHMKDMRASGFEPINVLSQYKYQDGLGYYESTRDAATHFFFSYLRGNKTYVFEYPLRVSHEGDFSNGVTTIQCMYAPEYTSHSEGMRVTVEPK